jgi:glycosyltransferase involved in cell wall biosynthesis
VVGLIAGGAIVGDEAYRDMIHARIAASQMGNRLRWLGHLEPIAPFLQALDVFVSTSVYETFGNSVCEAMACGLPVVAYKGGSVQEVVGDAGYVHDNGDVGALTRSLALLVDDVSERSRAGLQAQRHVATHFNPAASFDKVLRIYDSLRPA